MSHSSASTSRGSGDEAIDPARVQRVIGAMSGTPLLIAGDVMLDQFVFGRVNRISPEAPVPVLEYERDEYRVGGAANVATNAGALGASVSLLGVAGDDETAVRLRQMLRERGISPAAVFTEAGRQTTRKVRLVTNRHQQVARIDHEDDREIAPDTERTLIAELERAAPSARAIVLSDYLKGSVTRHLVARAVTIARDLHIPLLVDPKIPHLDYYKGATILTPNNAEAEAATQTRIRTDDQARIAARMIRDRLGCQAVLITRGESGMWLLDADRERPLKAATRQVADVTGAGDTVIATLALALASGADIVEAAILASAAAGVAVEKFGPAAVTPAELRSVMF